MNNKIYKTLLFIALIAGFVSCNKSSDKTVESVRYQFENILDIAYTPNADTRATGWFADAGKIGRASCRERV